MFVATMGNTVYAFDADDPAQSEPLWSRNLGTPAPGDSWIGPTHHGILGTPFIDVPTGRFMWSRWCRKTTNPTLWVHALDILHRQPQIQLSTAPVVSIRRTGGTLTNVKGALQRAGLLVMNDVLYIAFANVVPDPKDQHWSQEGFVQTFNARDLTQRLAVFQTTPSGRKGGIWQGGRGIATDGPGNIYLSTAGGYYDGVSNFGSSTLKFAGPALKLADWFTPDNHEFLFLQNIDLSAGGVTLIPNSPLMFCGRQGRRHFSSESQRHGQAGRRQRQTAPAVSSGQRLRPEGLRETLGTAFWGRQNDGVLYVWDRTGCPQSL